ncbi:CBS-domain-containing protein [Pseudovirgaria hyperparasitica]|uniref:CBS-domain-containing protein n=1 Tax=Pseudovirgaria hyperparasitica TaxID=470096 RepID=A0A6A6WC60_9PEZI|nr:CBS-domain-containing protein [Pseudovirgaria hyperparasitica]KAF2759157.1 CBS-domain-containing protein [Pseudovirgaria hyperparasitica]
MSGSASNSPGARETPFEENQPAAHEQQQHDATRYSSHLGNSSSGPSLIGAAGGHADSNHPNPAFQVVHPASYLRPRPASRPMTPTSLLDSDDPVDREQLQGLARGLGDKSRAVAKTRRHGEAPKLLFMHLRYLFRCRAIRAFLKLRTSYDVLPLSYRLIILDTRLLVKKSLNILLQNAIVSAPLWDSTSSTFAGLLTTSDYINVIQYYWQHPHALEQVDQFRLDSLRDIEKALHVAPIETVSIHPEKPLYEACRKMLQSRARRIPLIDVDDETDRPLVVSVITQYRILKFIAVNVKETQMLQKPLRDMNVGTYENIQTANMETPVIDIIHMLVRKNISSVPILDRDGTVINVFESVDVISVIKGGNYDELTLPVGEALLKRPDDFPGIYSCSVHDRLDTIFDTIRRSRVHRLVVIDEQSKLRGVLTLSDILEYILLEGVSGDEQ